MKKIILIVFFLVNVSCSKDEPKIVEYDYSATIQKTCPSGSRTTYSISKTTYENLGDYMIPGSVCEGVSFRDLSNISRTGYLRAIGRVSK